MKYVLINNTLYSSHRRSSLLLFIYFKIFKRLVLSLSILQPLFRARPPNKTAFIWPIAIRLVAFPDAIWPRHSQYYRGLEPMFPWCAACNSIDPCITVVYDQSPLTLSGFMMRQKTQIAVVVPRGIYSGLKDVLVG